MNGARRPAVAAGKELVDWAAERAGGGVQHLGARGAIGQAGDAFFLVPGDAIPLILESIAGTVLRRAGLSGRHELERAFLAGAQFQRHAHRPTAG